MTTSNEFEFTVEDVAHPLVALQRPDIHTNPYPFYDHLRSIAPIAPMSNHQWFVTSNALVGEVMNNDAQMSTQVQNASGSNVIDDLWAQYYQSELLFNDGERHAFLRSFANAAFKPRRVRKLRPQLEQDVNRLLDRVAQTGRLDLTADIAHPFTIEAVMRIIGLPQQSLPDVDRWSTAMGAMLDPTKGQDPFYRGPAIAALGEAVEYVGELLKERLANPQDDVLSDFAASMDQDGGLSSRDVMAIVIRGMINAGHATTTSQIGNSMLGLLNFPDQLERLVDNPQLMPNGVEELFRYDPAIQLSVRIAAQPVQVGGIDLAMGEAFLLSGAAANRDPEAFDHPNDIDVERKITRSFTSGAGEHYCLGAVLARLEIEVVLTEMFKRMTNFELLVPASELPRDPNVTLRLATSIPLSFDLR